MTTPIISVANDSRASNLLVPFGFSLAGNVSSRVELGKATGVSLAIAGFWSRSRSIDATVCCEADAGVCLITMSSPIGLVAGGRLIITVSSACDTVGTSYWLGVRLRCMPSILLSDLAASADTGLFLFGLIMCGSLLGLYFRRCVGSRACSLHISHQR